MRGLSDEQYLVLGGKLNDGTVRKQSSSEYQTCLELEKEGLMVSGSYFHNGQMALGFVNTERGNLAYRVEKFARENCAV